MLKLLFNIFVAMFCTWSYIPILFKAIRAMRQDVEWLPTPWEGVALAIGFSAIIITHSMVYLQAKSLKKEHENDS